MINTSLATLSLSTIPSNTSSVQDPTIKPQKKSASVSLTKNIYLGLIQWNYATSFSISPIKWMSKNRSFQIALPLFWKSSSPFKAALANFFDNIPSQVSEFIKYCAEQKKTTAKKESKNIADIIKKLGSCHGQCLAISESALKSPSVDPNSIINFLEMHPERICYFQTLEQIRGICNEWLCARQLFHQTVSEKSKDEKDLQRMVGRNLWRDLSKEREAGLFDEKSDQFKEIYDRVMNCFPVSDEQILLDFPNSNKKEMQDKFFHIFSEQKEAAIVIAGWNDEKLSNSHSVVYHCSEEHHSFWFYNSAIGLYKYPNAQLLRDNFIQHAFSLFVDSKRTSFQFQVFKSKYEV